MNLKTKYNAFMAEHPVLRGGAWLITKLLTLTLVAVLFVLEFLFRVLGNSNKDSDTAEYDPDEAARDAGYINEAHMLREQERYSKECAEKYPY
jgi:uncharacterized membrane protein